MINVQVNKQRKTALRGAEIFCLEIEDFAQEILFAFLIAVLVDVVVFVVALLGYLLITKPEYFDYLQKKEEFDVTLLKRHEAVFGGDFLPFRSQYVINELLFLCGRRSQGNKI